MDWLTDRLDLFSDPGWHLRVLGLGLGGRGLYLAVFAGVLLALTAVPAWRFGGEIRTRWGTWAMILPVVGIPLWTGRTATTVLAVLLAVGATLEYARVARLARADTLWLVGCAVILPLATLAVDPSRVSGVQVAGWVPWAILGGAGLPLLAADHVDGFRRAAMTAFGIVWLCWSLANLPLLGRDAFVVHFAAACADVGAFVGGRSLGRFAWARARLTPLSPNKTWGGVAGALVVAAVILLACDSLSFGWLLAVWVGGIAGDLLESMLKRQHEIKDAGDWLPGFGGLLDRIDSLLIAVPLAVLLH